MNLELSRSRFEELRASTAHPAVVTHLEELLAKGSDFDCYKINAFRLADSLGVPRLDAVRTCLFATRMGLLDLTWDIHCPSCKGLPEYSRHLMGLRNRVHCGLCEIDLEVDLEEQVEVTFTANPDIRPIDYKDFKDRTYPEQLLYFRETGAREKRGPVLSAQFEPGQTLALEGSLPSGEYHYYVPTHFALGGSLKVAGAPDARVRDVRVKVAADGSVDQRSLELVPGPVRVTVEFGYPKKWAFAVFRDGVPMNWVSAAYVTALQDFRDLFSGEFLAPDVSFAIRSTTLMFTDIKGSTEMYERLGDATAYRLVQEHFTLMATAIRDHEGGIVKTIGDAVMAAFPVNANAVRAACEIQDGFKKESERLRGIEVKIGLHRGPAIAVTSNRAVDFFGRTVNVAARVQGQSRPNEVLLTQPVLDDLAVGLYMKERSLAARPLEVDLKGIAGRQTLYSLRPAT